MSFLLQTQVQQQKPAPVTLLTQVIGDSIHLPPLLPNSPAPDLRFAFVDAFNNIKLAEAYQNSNRAVLLSQFGTEKPKSPFTFLCENPFSDQLILGDSSGKIEFFKISSKNAVTRAFKLHLSRINCLSFAEEEKLMVSASNDKTVKVFDISRMAKGKEHPLFLQCFSFKDFALKAEIDSQRNKLFALEKKALRFFDLTSKREVFSVEAIAKEKFVDFHRPAENLACLVTEAAGFKMIDLRSGKIERSFILPGREVRKSRLAKNTAQIICSGLTNGQESVFLLDALDPSPAGLFEFLPKSRTNDLFITQKGKYFVVGSQSDSVSLFKFQPKYQIEKCSQGKKSAQNFKAESPVKENEQKLPNLAFQTNSLKSSSLFSKPIEMTAQTRQLPEAQGQAQPRSSSPQRKEPLLSHGSNNQPLANLLSKDKTEQPPCEFTFDVSHIVSSLRQQNLLPENSKAGDKAVQINKTGSVKNQRDEQQAFGMRLFLSQNKSEESAELRTIDYNVTETKYNKSIDVGLNYKEIEEFIKQREDCIKQAGQFPEEDFSFKVSKSNCLHLEKSSKGDQIEGQHFASNVENKGNINLGVFEEKQAKEEANEAYENPFADVLGKTFKTREEKQIVIIDQKTELETNSIAS